MSLLGKRKIVDSDDESSPSKDKLSDGEVDSVDVEFKGCTCYNRIRCSKFCPCTREKMKCLPSCMCDYKTCNNPYGYSISNSPNNNNSNNNFSNNNSSNNNSSNNNFNNKRAKLIVISDNEQDIEESNNESVEESNKEEDPDYEESENECCSEEDDDDIDYEPSATDSKDIKRLYKQIESYKTVIKASIKDNESIIKELADVFKSTEENIKTIIKEALKFYGTNKLGSLIRLLKHEKTIKLLTKITDKICTELDIKRINREFKKYRDNLKSIEKNQKDLTRYKKELRALKKK